MLNSMTLKPKKSETKTNTDQLEHERLTSLINSMADAVIAVDEQIRIVLYNASALNIFDVNTIEAGSRLDSLFKPVDKEEKPCDITDVVKAVKVPMTDRDLRLRYADGSLINLYLSVAPVHLGYGSKGERGYVLLLRDITREKSLEEERDEFISVVSHELRTPIAIAEGNVGNAQFIAEKSGDINAIKLALKEAHSQILFLADMMNDLSTLSRAERGKLIVEIEPINIHDLLTELADNYQPEVQTKGLKMLTRLDPRLELLSSSKLYVREILQNFITNAIKYTAKGEVTISAAPEQNGVRFTVQDTGIGISKADQKRVFEKFFRSEDFRTRQANGTGLGLYVTMKLIHLIDAKVGLESKLNEGSTFTVFVPNLDKTEIEK